VQSRVGTRPPDTLGQASVLGVNLGRVLPRSYNTEHLPQGEGGSSRGDSGRRNPTWENVGLSGTLVPGKYTTGVMTENSGADTQQAHISLARKVHPSVPQSLRHHGRFRIANPARERRPVSPAGCLESVRWETPQ